MQRMNAIIRKVADILEMVVAVPLMILGGAMVVVVVAGTFWRYALNNPLLWTEEAARYLMIWVVLIGASVAMRRREHVRINVVVKMLPQFVQPAVRLASNVLIALFLYVLIKEGWEVSVMARMQMSAALRISMFWPTLAVPLAGFFTLLQLVLQIIIDFTGGEEQSW